MSNGYDTLRPKICRILLAYILAISVQMGLTGTCFGNMTSWNEMHITNAT